MGQSLWSATQPAGTEDLAGQVIGEWRTPRHKDLQDRDVTNHESTVVELLSHGRRVAPSFDSLTFPQPDRSLSGPKAARHDSCPTAVGAGQDDRSERQSIMRRTFWSHGMALIRSQPCGDVGSEPIEKRRGLGA